MHTNGSGGVARTVELFANASLWLWYQSLWPLSATANTAPWACASVLRPLARVAEESPFASQIHQKIVSTGFS